MIVMTVLSIALSMCRWPPASELTVHGCRITVRATIS